MGKTVTGLGDDGKIYSHRLTRHQKKSERSLIGWTEGPTTLRKKAARALWG